MKNKKIDIETILRPIPAERMHELTKEELIILLEGEQQLRKFFERKAEEQEALAEELKEEVLLINGKLARIKCKFFGKSSERSKERPKVVAKGDKDKKKREGVNRLPSERYPNAPVIEKDVDFVEAPVCGSCQGEMKDSGMTEDSEYLTVIPKQYMIVRQKRHKYRCEKCHGCLETAPLIPRIRPGSSFSDELIIDASLSKYCDLIPMERYATMAKRQGFEGLPPQSLIEGTHYLAEFVRGVYNLLKGELCSLKVLAADETPHRMLEGDEKNHWYLWGFSGERSCYFECHDTRAGTVALEVLKDASCDVLLSDVYSGYGKAVKDVNILRGERGLNPITNAFCNAHARRKFKEAEAIFAEAKYYIDQYQEIYKLEKSFKETPILNSRQKMKVIFEEMKERAQRDMDACSSKSAMGVALNYFIKNYDGLTLFIGNLLVPIDNNAQERNLRSSVIGRKTWYGTHSKKGAETMAILFSIVESCKLNKINPRSYFTKLIKDLHSQKLPYTPKQFLEQANPPN